MSDEIGLVEADRPKSKWVARSAPQPGQRVTWSAPSTDNANRFSEEQTAQRPETAQAPPSPPPNLSAIARQLSVHVIDFEMLDRNIALWGQIRRTIQLNAKSLRHAGYNEDYPAEVASDCYGQVAMTEPDQLKHTRPTAPRRTEFGLAWDQFVQALTEIEIWLQDIEPVPRLHPTREAVVIHLNTLEEAMRRLVVSSTRLRKELLTEIAYLVDVLKNRLDH